MTSLCESVPSLVHASAHQFDNESVLQQISLVMRLCGVTKQFADKSELPRISSLTR
jgi:hypothetical protein